MARPKSINREEKPVITQDEAGEAQIALDGKISALLSKLLQADGLSKAAFGRKIDFTQANLSNVFSTREECKQNHWSFPLLIAASKYFGVQVGDLISAAEDFADAPTSDAVRLFIACRKTKRQSRERLQRLIWAAVDYEPARTKAADRALFDLVYGVSQVELGNPIFCKQYYSGLLSDADVLAAFKQALAEENSPDKVAPDSPPLPLWAALQKNWKGEKK